MVEQGTHKPLVGGSNPPSATNDLSCSIPERIHPRAVAAAPLPYGSQLTTAAVKESQPATRKPRPPSADTTIASPKPSNRPRTMRMIGAAGLRPRRASCGTRVLAKRIEQRSGRPSGIAIGPSLVDLPRVPPVACWLRLATTCHLTRPHIVLAAHNPPHPTRTYGRIPFTDRP